MTKQFWVNNYFIDVTRNQIQHQQQATPIPPKALKVLEVLASRAGEVVSHDELMDIVWEKSVVGPNTLQRAIAQLRKAFGDDSKQQAFIKTHAKKGYSLEAHVRWEGNELALTQSDRIEPPKQPKHQLHLFVLACIAAIFLLSLLLWPSKSFIYDRVTPLTASDEQEFNATYSPDGKYLVFNRFVGQCESHLWAKDLTNNQEERLSAVPGHYSRLSWSADGSQLAFVLQSDCSDGPAKSQQCWQLQTLDFAQAWNGNGKNLLRYDCAGVKTTHPTWLNDGRIALLQYIQLDGNQPELMIYDAVSDTLVNVPHEQSGRIYSLDYSRETELLATVTLEDNNTHVLRTLTPAGDVRQSAVINALENHSVYARFPIKFSPDGTHFLTDVEGKIYQLELNGNLTLIHPISHSGLWTPSYHPNQNKFAVTFGTKDFDIGYLNTEKEHADIDVFSRSTTVDVNAKFQPNGDMVAFVSQRSGKRQLWLIDGRITFQLTHFEQGVKSSRFDWSPDGTSLAVNVNNQVVLVNLDGNYQTVDSPAAIDMLMPWTNPDKVLITDNQSDTRQLFSLDIHTGETIDLNLSNVVWAAYYQEGSIIYVDSQAKAWLFTDGKNQPIGTLDNKLFGDYMLIKNGQLYGVDSQAQLWHYSIENDELNVISALNKDVVYISDIKGEEMLASKFIGGRRELVEFSHQ